jgi:hypothetical protein
MIAANIQFQEAREAWGHILIINYRIYYSANVLFFNLLLGFPATGSSKRQEANS